MILPCLLAGAVVSSSFAQIHFLESAAVAGVGDAGEGNGAAFGDVNGDGWPDLLVTRTSPREPALLYLNQRNGRFVNGAASWTAPLAAVGGLFVDYDGDGDQDLYLIIHQRPNELQRNDAGVLTVIPQPETFRESGVATSAFFADLDGDGAIELFSTHRFSQANQWVHVPGTANMADLSLLVSPLRAGDDTFGATPFDFDADGDLDVYVSAFSRANLLHRNDGAGQFRTIPHAAGMASVGASIAALAADADGDGRLDLYVVNAIGQSNQLFIGRGAGTDARFQDATTAAGLDVVGNSSGAAWADFDNDGDEDLLVSNVAMPLQIYRNDGDASFADVTASAVDLSRLPESGTTGVAIDDIDRDGDIDVFLTSPGGSDVLLVNDGAGGDWLEVDPGRAGVRAGTRIETVTDGRRQVRVFTVVSSVGTQHGDLLHFGLGQNAADSVEIRIIAPDGAQRTMSAASGQVVSPDREAPAVDLAVARVLSPGLAPGWEGFQPRVDVQNRGRRRSAATALIVRAVGPGRPYERQQSVEPLEPGATQSVSFTAWRPDLPGLWEISFRLTGEDDVPANDLWRHKYHFHEFRDVAADLGVDDAGPGWAGAFADYDNDGDLDLYVSNGGSLGNGDNILYRNDLDAGFLDVAAPAGVADADNGTGVVFADFDRDGDQDLFIAKGGFSPLGQPNRMFRNEGDGSFRDVSAAAGVDVSRSSYAAVVGDYDLDGYLDLYVSQLRGQQATFYHNRQGAFEDVTRSKQILSFLTFSGAAASFSDYDNDGDIDLYAGVFGDFDRFYADIGDTAYTVASVGARGEMVGIALGDYDEDGDLDVYTVNQRGRSALYQNQTEVPAFLDVGSETGTENMALGTGCAFVDYDSDGDLDLLVANAFSNNLAYVNLGDGTFLDQSEAFGLADLARARAVLVGDIDNDGDPDIYVINEGAANRLYANGGGPNGWLSVAVRGVTSNPDAIGARLTAWVEGRSFLREVNGTAGMSYSSRVTHFGLGSARGVDSLVVRWPGGSVDHHGPTPANTALHLIEGGPATIVAEAAVLPTALALAEAYPNPFNADVALRFELPDTGPVRLVICNALGQRVRVLVNNQMVPAGTHHATWDGRDEHAREAASGVYHARLEASGNRRIRSLVLLR
ncbi:MAG: FG-GAP-like repeat-containing protein [bacterium]|nr:FG-GAP-like repeat-containing protein [bacterium]